MWIYKENKTKYPWWKTNIPRRNIPWPMLMLATKVSGIDQVHKLFDSDASQWWNEGYGTGNQVGVDVDELGNVYSSGIRGGSPSRSLFKYDWETGTILWSVDTTQNAQHLRYYSGYVYVATAGGLKKYGATTGNLIWTATASSSSVIGVDVDESTGNVFYSGDTFIKSVDSDGNYRFELINDGGTSVKVKGSVYVCGAYESAGAFGSPGHIRVIDTNGNRQTQFGGVGTGHDAFGIDVDDKHIAVGSDNGIFYVYTKSPISLTYSATWGNSNNTLACSFNKDGELFVGGENSGSDIRLKKLSTTFSTIYTKVLPADILEIKARYTY